MKISFYQCAIAASAAMSIGAISSQLSASPTTVDGCVTAADGYTYNQEMSFKYTDKKKKGKKKDDGELVVAPDSAWLRTKQDAAGIQVALTLPTSYVDNSYGDNSVGWGDDEHKLDQLGGSDKAYFLIRDQNNNANSIQLSVDYMARKLKLEKDDKIKNEYKDESKASINGAKEIKADEKDANKLDPFWNEFKRSSSMEWNLLNFVLDGSGDVISGKEGLVGDSPETTSSTSYDLVDPSAYGDWKFDVTYEFSLSAAALAMAGISNAEILLYHAEKEDEIVHASPSKYPNDKIGYFEPIPEPASALLMLGAVGFLATRRRKASR